MAVRAQLFSLHACAYNMSMLCVRSSSTLTHTHYAFTTHFGWASVRARTQQQAAGQRARNNTETTMSIANAQNMRNAFVQAEIKAREKIVGSPSGRGGCRQEHWLQLINFAFVMDGCPTMAIDFDDIGRLKHRINRKC